MKLPSYRRIFKQDYSTEIQDDIETLGITVNDSFETIYEAFNNRITFSENINCTITSFDTSVNNSGVPTTPVTIKLSSFQSRVIGIIPINVKSSRNQTILPNGAVFIDYTINNNTTSSSNATNSGNNSGNPLTININNIKGLPAGVVFTITAIII